MIGTDRAGSARLVSPSGAGVNTGGYQQQQQQSGGWVPPSATANQNEILKTKYQFLERKCQYLQTVGALFRQKLAVIVRDCVRTTHMGPHELQAIYTATMEEIQKSERDMQADPPQRDAIGYNNENFNSSTLLDDKDDAASRRSWQRSAEAKEDVRKAHLICVALQERNDIKLHEMELKRQLNELQSKHDDLLDRHKKIVLLQSGSVNAPPGSAIAAMKELYDGRIKELEESLFSLKAENVKLTKASSSSLAPSSTTATARGGGGPSPQQQQSVRANSLPGSVSSPTAEKDSGLLFGDPSQLVSGDNTASEVVEQLTRQNHMLKARVQRMKDEITTLKQQSLGSTLQLNEGLDSLLVKISDQQKVIDEKETHIQQLTNDKRELAKECVAHRAQVDMYVKQLELFVKDADTSQLSHARRANQTKGEAQNLSSAVDEYLLQINQKDDVIQNLMHQLREEKQKHQERVLEVRALGVQLDTFRSKLDALQAQQSQRDLQQHMVQDMHNRLFSAVETIQQTQNTSTLTAKLDDLSMKLRRMEDVDLQLRQKEDELVLLKDEMEQVKEDKDELFFVLNSITSMFRSFPKSVRDLEKMMIQVEEYRNEIETCAAKHLVPDVVHVEGKVELRMMEVSEKSKKGSTNHHHHATAPTPPAAATADNGGLQQQQPADNGQMDEDDVWEKELEKQLASIMNVPPLPSLAEVTQAIQATVPPMSTEQPWMMNTSATIAALSPARTAQPSSSAGLGFLSPSGGPGSVQDVRLTFELFDDQSAGVLTADLLKLCLATLGIRRQLPSSVTHMTEDEFLVFCCGQNTVS